MNLALVKYVNSASATKSLAKKTLKVKTRGYVCVAPV